MTLRSTILWLGAFVLLALLPLMPGALGDSFYVGLVTNILVLAIFALSLQLLVGYTGLVSLGHAAYFGAAAYAVAMLAPDSGPANGWLLLVAAVGTAALLALVIGFLVMRTRGIYFIMVTLAFAQLVYFIVHDFDVFGGTDGTYIYFRPAFNLFGRPLVDLEDGTQFYWFTLVMLALTVVLLGLVLRSRFGHALAGIKHNEQRMRAAGYATNTYKLGSFVLGGALAGLAGFLYASQHGYVNPEMLSWHNSGNALVMIILGGLGSLPGAILGAFSYVLLNEWFQGLTKHWQLLMGGTIILVAAMLPQGLAGGITSIRNRLARSPRASVKMPESPTDGAPSPTVQLTGEQTL